MTPMQYPTSLLFASLILATAPVRSVEAQNVDSLTALLSSPIVRIRASALVKLGSLSPAQLAPAASTIISLLEREAMGTATSVADMGFDRGDGGDTYKEYVIALSEAALALHDQRATRGIALLGIETSRAAEMFVVAQGSVGAAALEEAWNIQPDSRPSVMSAWGLMLAPGAPTLTAAALRSVIVHQVAPPRSLPPPLEAPAQKPQTVSLHPLPPPGPHT